MTRTDFSLSTKWLLRTAISKTAECRYLYSLHPGSDFTRDRKLDFETMLRLILTLGGSSLSREILSYFRMDVSAPSKSAFNQQRAKILPDAFAFLFHIFNNASPNGKKFRGRYRLLACDGSILPIALDPSHLPSYIVPDSRNPRGYNQLHINALYDLCSKRYVDAEIAPIHDYDERSSLNAMVDRYPYDDIANAIFICDRGYSAYNSFAHIIKKGAYFLIRVKDVGTARSILKTFDLPDTPSFDEIRHRFLTRSLTATIKSPQQKEVNKFLHHDLPFDFIDEDDKKLFPITLRILRFPISEDNYECIVTNLPYADFSTQDIKELYHMRWGIETSFRSLKYSLGLISFHSRKIKYIYQEIYAALLLYNISELVISHLEDQVTGKGRKKYKYQINADIAFCLMKDFLKLPYSDESPGIDSLIKKYLLPVRPDRRFDRNISKKSAIGFGYRIR